MQKKWNLQDIRPAGASKAPARIVSPGATPPTQRTMHRDIAPRPRPTQTHSEEYYAEPALDPDLATIDVIDGNSAKRKRVVTTSIVGIVILSAAFLVNVLLGGAQVTVYPKTKAITVQSEFSGFTAPQVNELGYELLSLEASAEKQVKAAGKENVSEHATGKVFVYNTKSTSPQRLITNTRFESPDGLIYRIKESIEVPGASKDAGGNLVPGKVVAEVYADGTGEQYNIQPTRFTVPGLKGSDQYDSVYAESTSPFTGGFEGEKYIIDDAELQTAKQELHIQLRDTLLAQLKEQMPAGFVVYEGAVTFAFDSLPSTEYGESLATIKERARLQVPMFMEKQFASYIAKQSIPDYKGEPVYLKDPKTLTFAYKDPQMAQMDIATLTTIDFILTGSTQVIWQFDADELKQTFKNYPSISNAKAELRPFWATSFPKNPNDIDIITVVE
jgi:hypothetical protein